MSDPRAQEAHATVLHAMKCGLDGSQPNLTLPGGSAAYTVGFASAVALTWIRAWHRLVLALGVTDEQITAIEADPDLAARADVLVANYIDHQIAESLTNEWDHSA